MTRLMWTLTLAGEVVTHRPIDGDDPVEVRETLEHEVNLHGLGADAHVEVTAVQGAPDGGR